MITLVQSAKADSVSAASNSVTLTATAGNALVVVGVSYNPSTTGTVSDSMSDAFTTLQSVVNSGGFSRMILAFCASAAGGSTTVTYSNSTGFASICVMEFSGLSAADTSAQQISSSNLKAWPCGSVTPSASGELLVAAVGVTTSETFSAPAGFTLAQQSTYPANDTSWAAAYMVQAAAAAINPSFGGTAFHTYGMGAVAAFKGSAPPAPLFRRDRTRRIGSRGLAA